MSAERETPQRTIGDDSADPEMTLDMIYSKVDRLERSLQDACTEIASLRAELQTLERRVGEFLPLENF